MTKFELDQSRENLTTHSGLALIGRLFSWTSISDSINRVITTKQKGEVTISHGDVVVSYMGLLSQGKSDYEAIEEFRNDDFFKLSLDLQNVPSSSTLRQRLDDLALLPDQQDLKQKLKQESARLLGSQKVELTPTLGNLIALDLDVSPYDNSGTRKEEVSRTYKGFDGYSPMFAYLGLEGYQINAELRPGKQHCQKDTPAFLHETLTLVRLVTDAPLLVRMDSGNDAKENLFILQQAKNVDYLIKRNLRRESKQEWLEKAKKIGVKEKVRKGKTVYRGREVRSKSVKVDGETEEFKVTCLFKVSHYTHDHKGQLLDKEVIEVESYWTSLPECLAAIKNQSATSGESKANTKNNRAVSEKNTPDVPDVPDVPDASDAPDATNTIKRRKKDAKVKRNVEEIIDQYHHHGTSEQFHSEQKSDMGLERFPSGHFATNHLILIMALVVYNFLRIIGQTANRSDKMPMRKSATRRRLRTVIQNLIYIASRLVRHARRFKLRFGAHSPWFNTFEYVYQQLAPT